MQALDVPFPTDPAARRRVWRELTHVDAPATHRATAVRARDADRPDDDWTTHAIAAPPAVIAGLRAAIDAAIIDGHLALVDRDRLIRRAMRLGLGRFEANLLIAAVQHRAGVTRDVKARDDRVIRHVWTRPRQSWSVARLLGACVAIEAMIVGAAVLLMAH